MNYRGHGLLYSSLFAGGLMWTAAAALFVGVAAVALGLAWASGYCFAVGIGEYVREAGGAWE